MGRGFPCTFKTLHFWEMSYKVPQKWYFSLFCMNWFSIIIFMPPNTKKHHFRPYIRFWILEPLAIAFCDNPSYMHVYILHECCAIYNLMRNWCRCFATLLTSSINMHTTMHHTTSVVHLLLWEFHKITQRMNTLHIYRAIYHLISLIG